MTPLRWGILSTARIGLRRVIPAIQRSHSSTVVAIASRERERAAAVASRFGIPRAHGSYEELLADPEVEAIYNPLPNSLHADWSIRAARAGKHVLCEKPLAGNADQAARMVEACARAGVLLQEAFMYRFHPQIERMVELVRSGGIGPPWLVRAAFTFGVGPGPNIRLEPTLGGGGLLDVGCYCVNVARLILGEPRTAFAAAEEERGVDVRLAGALRFDGSRMALVDCGLRAPYRQVCEVVGTEGSLLLRRPFQPEEDATEIVVRRARGEPEERIEIPGTNQYVLMVEHFAAVVAGAPARYPPQDAVANMRALDALAAAARTGAPAEVAEG